MSRMADVGNPLNASRGIDSTGSSTLSKCFIALEGGRVSTDCFGIVDIWECGPIRISPRQDEEGVRPRILIDLQIPY